MNSFNTWLPICKVDKDKRMVWGFASTPTKDLQGEIVSLDAIKAALPSYMEWANIREMHQPSAVGICKHAEIVEGGDTDKEGLFIGAKITDDDAWAKCKPDEDGDTTYKGFSIGGEKLNKVGDTVTQVALYEISIVDRPANPDCRITVAKAIGFDDSSATPVSSAPAAEVKAGSVVEAEPVFDRHEVGLLARMMAKLSGKSASPAQSPNVSTAQPTNPAMTVDAPPTAISDKAADAEAEKRAFSDKEREHLADTGAAMSDGSFPISNEKDLRNAVLAHGRAKDPDKAKAHIVSRAKELNLTHLLPKDWEGSTKDEKSLTTFTMVKGLGWNFQSAAQCYDALRNWEQGLGYESNMEAGDPVDEEMAEKVRAIRQQLGALLADKITHEIGEDDEDLDHILGKDKEEAEKAAETIMNKRYGNTTKAAMMKGHGFVKKAMGTHDKMSDHLENAMKCFGKCMGKAAGDPMDMGHIKELGEHMAKAVDSASATEEHLDSADAHLGKATSGWTEESETPAQGGHGDEDVAPSQSGEGWDASKEKIEDKTVSEMTEGEVPEMDPTKPYAGKSAKPNPEVEALKALVAELNQKIEKIGAQPATQPKGKTFDTSALDGKQPERIWDNPLSIAADKDLQMILGKTMGPDGAKDALDRVAKGELKAEDRQKLATRAFGTLARGGIAGDPDLVKFAHPVVDPRFSATNPGPTNRPSNWA